MARTRHERQQQGEGKRYALILQYVREEVATLLRPLFPLWLTVPCLTHNAPTRSIARLVDNCCLGLVRRVARHVKPVDRQRVGLVLCGHVAPLEDRARKRLRDYLL